MPDVEAPERNRVHTSVGTISSLDRKGANGIIDEKTPEAEKQGVRGQENALTVRARGGR